MSTRNRRRRPPWHYNPPPRFGLRLPRCRQCGGDVWPGDNPIIDMGNGVFVKFGLCARCLGDEMEERRRDDEAFG